MRTYRSLPSVVLVAACVAGSAGCKGDAPQGPPVPASSDPDGRDLVPGAIVAAFEKGAAVKREAVRLYKVVDSIYFPPPMSDELVLIAYEETSPDFQTAAARFASGKLTIAAPQVRVQRHMFRMRDYRVLTNLPVTDADRSAKAASEVPTARP